MKYRIWVWLFFAISGILGLEIQPDSLSRTLRLLSYYYAPIDTIVLYNPGSERISIDTVFIKFLNGSIPTDFQAGKDCDPTHFYQYVYQGWVYGSDIVSLRYVSDSIFLLQDSVGIPRRYQLQPGDSLLFHLNVISNCPVCGRMPSFPATTRFLYSFIAAEGGATFLLTLDQPTAVSPARISSIKKPVRGIEPYYNLRGQKVGMNVPTGLKVRIHDRCLDLPPH